MRRSLAALIAVLAIGVGACSSDSGDTDKLQKSMNRLSVRISTLEEQVSEIEDELSLCCPSGRLVDRLDELETFMFDLDSQYSELADYVGY